MADELFNRTRPEPARKGRGRSIFLMLMLALILGAGLVGWLAYDGRLRFDPELLRERPEVNANQQRSAPLAALPNQSALPPAVEAAASGFDARLAALEQRLARLDLQADAASGNAARAEGLLIAFAARRAIERGAPLGYLEDQLRLRFADAQPNAVELVIEASRQPVTIAQLASSLDALETQLTKQIAQESGWGWLKREVSDLFVIRTNNPQTALPAARLAQVRLLLRTGQVEQAASEVQRLPGAASASDWIGDARRYASAARALDLIETTAILEPRKLNDSDGQRVEQPSLLAEPPRTLPARAEATY